MKKILVIRFSSIGDIVLTTPVVRCLKKQLGAEIHFLTKKNFEKIVASNPNIDRVFSIEKDISEVVNDLKSMNYDFVIDLHKNLRSWQVKRQLGVKSLSFQKLNIQKWLMVNFKINYLPNKHIVDRNLETVAVLGVKNDGAGLDYFIPKHDEVELSDYISFEGDDRSFIAFAIGAAHATKRLPAEKIIEICDKIKLPIVLLGGKEDMENADLIYSKSSSYIVNLVGKLNLNQSASVVRQAPKVITHDTGLMHIAAAFQKEIISIWGSTVPEFGMTPYTKDSEIIEVKGLSCRPCSKIGFDKCPKGHFKCMQMIDTLAVAASVNSVE